MTYRKKPEEVEALQFSGDNQKQLADFTDCVTYRTWEDGFLQLDLIKGDLFILPGEYVVKNENGEFSKMKEETFHRNYELK